MIGAAAGVPFLLKPGDGRAARIPVHEWRGIALGAEARIVFAGLDEPVARRLAGRAVTEIHRLERIFSLFIGDSEIVRLNRDGRLDAPSADLRLVLAESARIAALTGGAFDITVQPLWRLFARHFASPGATAPDAAALAATLDLVDYRAIEAGPARIAFAKRGMAITMNGIAQGYITDRVAEMLRAGGIDRVLVQLGETRAEAPPEGRAAWRIALPGADGGVVVDLAERAVATSRAGALTFGANGPSHILDPKRGMARARHETVSVIAPCAMTADAVSTALCVLPPAVAREIVESAGVDRIDLTTRSGTRRIFTA